MHSGLEKVQSRSYVWLVLTITCSKVFSLALACKKHIGNSRRNAKDMRQKISWHHESIMIETPFVARKL